MCKQRVVALLLMELLSKMRKMRTITPLDARLKPALSSGGIRITKFLIVYKKKKKKKGGVNLPRFLKCVIPPRLTLETYELLILAL